ncbi:hypothetical protein LJC68_04875 [Bacteroidales bacterium OttesenSCG-928-B11]|nr:hypothetical protein [Bacteroidales bacterium OttesenSCG-928-E04]MDL2312190.1 hypothetical protein [Bacteroidales bacterium OttesenSCG-928-B11]
MKWQDFILQIDSIQLVFKNLKTLLNVLPDSNKKNTNTSESVFFGNYSLIDGEVES